MLPAHHHKVKNKQTLEKQLTEIKKSSKERERDKDGWGRGTMQAATSSKVIRRLMTASPICSCLIIIIFF